MCQTLYMESLFNSTINLINIIIIMITPSLNLCGQFPSKPVFNLPVHELTQDVQSTISTFVT